VSGFAVDPCDKCEEVLQPFLDRDLNEEERALAEEHLSLCDYCRKRYRFEEELRRFVRQAASYWFSIRRVFSKAPQQLFRLTSTFVANNGLSRYPYGRTAGCDAGGVRSGA